MNRDTEKAFHWILEIIERNEIPYKISGGFAARVHGVDRELADIDIEMPEEYLKIVQNETSKYIISPLHMFIDENWKILLMTLNYEGQEIDMCSTEAQIFNQKTKTWEQGNGNLENFVEAEVYGENIKIDSIQSLISYKTKLGREVDIEDVKQLKSIWSKSLQEKLKQEGFPIVYEWHDKPGTVYENHAHQGKVSFYVIDGSVSMSFGIERVVSIGERFDVPVGIEHSAKVGENGCQYVVGQEIEGDA
jgi:hypothetical protein